MTALVEELGELVKETRGLLASPDPPPEAWVEYGKRREAIFASLREKNFQLVGEERETVSRLIEEILNLSRMVEKRTEGHLAHLRSEISQIYKNRRALKGYARFRPAAHIRSIA